MIEIRSVESRAELAQVFDLVGGEVAERVDRSDFRFADLGSRFPADKPLMVMATANDQPVGAALAFRADDGWATLRIIAVVEAFRYRGIGRRLVECVETEAGVLGVEAIGLGTEEAVGFWFDLGYTAELLLQWAYDAELYEEESKAVLAEPLAGMRHRRSSFKDVPQLFAELDQPRLNLRQRVQDMVNGCHVGFMMSKKLHGPSPDP